MENSETEFSLHLKNAMKKIRENRLNSSPEKSPSKKFKCEKCQDTTWIIDGSNFKRCECYELRKAEEMFKNSGITDETYTFTNFKVWNKASGEMKEIAAKYYSNFMEIKDKRQNSIGFFGQVGSGKSHLTIALGLNILQQKKLSVVYFSYRDAITEIKQNMLDEEYYKKQIHKFQNAKVLLIDDLLKGKINEADKNIMFEIINHRYISRLPIIVSSEYTVNDLLNWDEAIGSRIYEMCKDYLVEIRKTTDNNYRLRDKKE